MRLDENRGYGNHAGEEMCLKKFCCLEKIPVHTELTKKTTKGSVALTKWSSSSSSEGTKMKYLKHGALFSMKWKHEHLRFRIRGAVKVFAY